MKAIILLLAFGILLSFSITSVEAATRIKTIEFFINNTAAQMAANAWYNTTFDITLPESGVSVKSAHVEVYGVSPAGTAGSLDVLINNSNLSRFVLPGGSEWFGFRYFSNGTNRTTHNNGMLYNLTDNTKGIFVLSLRPTTAINALSSKAVITYEYDNTSATQLQTVQFFINSSANRTSTTKGHNTLFQLQLDDANPSVKSAWFEIGGQSNGVTALTNVTVGLNGTQLRFGGTAAISTATADSESFIINVNATNTTANSGLYLINNNNRYGYNLTVMCTGAPCNALYEKAFITYTVTTIRTRTLEFFVNSTGTATAGAFQNTTFNVQLHGGNPKVKSAFVVIYGGLIGTANTMDVFLNETRLNEDRTIELDFGGAESSGFKIALNASNRTSVNTGLYTIADNTKQIFRLAIRCNTAQCNAVSSKVIITYNFTSVPNQTHAIFFINRTNENNAAGTWMNTTRTLQLPESTLKILSAYIETVGSMGSTLDLTQRVTMGRETVPNDAMLWDSSGTGTPGYSIKSFYNATNTTESSTPWGLVNNTATAFAFGVQCTGSLCNGLGQTVTLTYTFSTAAVIQTFRPNITVTITFTGNSPGMLSFIRQPSDTLTLAQSSPRIASQTRLFSNIIDFTDAIQKLFTFLQQTANAIDVTESASQSFSLIRLLSNAIDLTDAATRIVTFIRNIANTFTLTTDILTTLISGATKIVATLAIDLTDAATRLLSFTRAITDAIDLTDIVTRATTLGRAFTNAIDITDNIQILFTRVRLLSNAIDFTDIITRAFSLIRTLTNAIDLTDAATRIVTFIRSAADAITFAMNITTRVVASFPRLVSLAIDFTDNIQTIFNQVRLIANAIDLTETFTRLQSLTRIFANAIDLTDAISNARLVLRQITNAIDITDNIQTIFNQVRLIANIIDLTDAATRLLSFTRAITDAIDLTDAVQRFRIVLREISVALDITDVLSRLVSFLRSLTAQFVLTPAIPCPPLCPPVESAPPEPSPSPGTGGGFVYPGIPVITKQPSKGVELVKFPILVGVYPGNSVVEGILVKNKLTEDITNLKLEVEGIPKEWVFITPVSNDLKPSEIKGYTFVITVPKDAEFGEHKVLLKLKDSIVDAEMFFILRIKNSYLLEDKPTIVREVTLDYTVGKTYVKLLVANPTEKNRTLVEVTEEIPKILALSAKDVDFEISPEIIQDDPVVKWGIPNLLAGDTKTFTYSVKTILQEFTPYIYFPLRELSVVDARLPTGFNLVQLKLPNPAAGTTDTGSFVIQNNRNETEHLQFLMQLPEGWKLIPESIETDIGAGERREFKFSVTVPEGTLSGSYVGSVIFNWGKDSYVRDVVINVPSFPIMAMLISFGILGTAGAVYYFVYIRKRERPMAYNLRRVAIHIVQEESTEIQKEVRDVQKLREQLAVEIQEHMQHEMSKRMVADELREKIRKRYGK